MVAKTTKKLPFRRRTHDILQCHVMIHMVTHCSTGDYMTDSFRFFHFRAGFPSLCAVSLFPDNEGAQLKILFKEHKKRFYRILPPKFPVSRERTIVKKQ